MSYCVPVLCFGCGNEVAPLYEPYKYLCTVFGVKRAPCDIIYRNSFPDADSENMSFIYDILGIPEEKHQCCGMHLLTHVSPIDLEYGVK